MYNKLFLLFFVILTTSLKGQDSSYYKYNVLIKKADKNAESRNYKSALIDFDTAFKIIDFIPYHYYSAFETAVSDSDYLKAKEYLIKGTQKGLDILFFNSEEINLFNRCIYAREYWGIKDSLLKNHFNSIDTGYYNKLCEMKVLDQSKRDDSPQSFTNDRLNFENLIQLSLEKGFPNFIKAGYGHNIAWILLWHHRGDEYPNSKQWQRIIPLINIEIANGTEDPDFFKAFDDYSNKKGKYFEK